MPSQTTIELRQAFKARGIAGASQLSNLQMREKLGIAVDGSEDSQLATIIKSALTKPAAADTAAEPKAPRAKAPKAPREPNADSIKAYLQGVLASEGRVSIADAIAHAAKTGRSKITVYVQAKQLGLSAARGTDNPDKGFFVKK